MADRPMRIQLRRTKGWRMPENTVKVDRGTYFGNPFRIIRCAQIVGAERTEGFSTDEALTTFFTSRDEAAAQTVEMFRAWLASKHPDAEKLRVAVSTLRGKNLACWCKQGSPCHADVLLELANAEEPGND